jgi:hypothetical protein
MLGGMLYVAMFRVTARGPVYGASKGTCPTLQKRARLKGIGYVRRSFIRS